MDTTPTTDVPTPAQELLDPPQIPALIMEHIPEIADTSPSCGEALNRSLQYLQDRRHTTDAPPTIARDGPDPQHTPSANPEPTPSADDTPPPRPSSHEAPSAPTPGDPHTFLEDLILASATHNTPRILDPTPTQQALERELRLAKPTTLHRFVFQDWPRAPSGAPILKDTPAAGARQGKTTGNGLEIWGATLFDFYRVQRLPAIPHGCTFSSGSRIAAWMRAHGEGYAADMLKAAEEEADPRRVWPYPIARLIMEAEKRPGETKSWARWHEAGAGEEGKMPLREDWELPDNWPPASPFEPRAYPSPWPDAPFSTTPPTLQSYITQSQLPAKLIVHDPQRVLKARGYGQSGYPHPKATEDITHTYTLTTSEKHTARAASDAALLADSDATRRRIRAEFLQDPTSARALPSGLVLHRRRTPGACPPPIFIVFPHLPERARVPAAHLYLSAGAALGAGSHSFVYRAELELPRAFLVDEAVCARCACADAAQLLEAQDGARGERREARWEALSGRYVVRASRTPSGARAQFRGEDGVERAYVARAPGEATPTLVYEGPYRAIETRVRHQDLAAGGYCAHRRRDAAHIHPLTSTVRVAAKLSVEHDAHLAREAENYQAFPRHFFEHWSGYNIVPPVKHPVPVTPVVPQYYGYYVVDRGAGGPALQEEEGEHGRAKLQDEKPEEYLSPILLMEDCGTAIDPNKLAIDDKFECSALIYKFNHSQWAHHSVARRNIVRQPGPLDASPEERAVNAARRKGWGTNWSYRLIDFGRSRRYEDMKSDDDWRFLREDQLKVFKWSEDGVGSL